MKFAVLRAALLVAASSTAVLAASAYAQDSDSSGQNGDVVVTGTRAALEDAEREKRDSGVLIDGISADDIGELPDISIADSLVRIPGLNANDDEDGFNEVSVRGLGPQLTNTTYNGRVLPTLSVDDRNNTLGDLPSEGIARAYVQKTADGATIEGGAGGTIALESVRPLETKRHGLSLVARGTIDSVINQIDGPYGIRPIGSRYEASFIKRLAPNFGIALTYSYLGVSNASPSTQFTTYKTSTLTRADLDNDGAPDAYPANTGIRMGTQSHDRHAVLGTVQWDPISSIRLTADGFYVTQKNRNDTTSHIAAGIANPSLARPGYSVVENDTVVAYEGQAQLYRVVQNGDKTKNNQYEGGLNLAFDDGGPIKFQVDASYARDTSNGETRQTTIENAAANAVGQDIAFGYDVRDQLHPLLNFEPLNANQYSVASITIGRPQRSDTSKALRADFSYRPRKSWINSIMWGMRVDDRLKVNDPSPNTLYNTSSVATRPVLGDSFLETAVNPLSRVSQYLGGPTGAAFPLFNLDAVETLEPLMTANNQIGAAIGNRSSIDETSYAVYAEANLRAGRLSGNVGARYFITDELVQGYTGTTEYNKVLQRFNHSYHYLLPSANFKFDVTRKLDVRFAVGKTMSRVAFSNLHVGTNVDVDTLTGGDAQVDRGNPNLKPFTAKNVDLGFNWSPNRHMTFGVQGFYKAISNYVINDQIAGTIIGSNGESIDVTINSHINAEGVRHYEGIEVLFRRDFNFLPGFLSHTGLNAHYTHNWTDAEQSFNSIQLVGDPGGLGTIAGGGKVTVPANNFHPNVYNAQLFYSTKGMDLRLAYRYYDGYTRVADNAKQSHEYGQFDLSSSLTLRRNVRLLGTIRNLTKTKSLEYFVDNRNLDSDAAFRSNVYDGREFTLGIRVQL